MMQPTQQINLFLPEFRVKKDPITAVLMLQVVGVIAVFMLLLGGIDSWRRGSLNTELEALQAELAQEIAKSDDLQRQLAGRSENTELLDRLDRAQARLDSSRQIRNFLGETKLGNVDGFSEHLKDLSRASSEGLTLREFTLNEGGDEVVLTGMVMNPAMLPRFVNNIQRGNSPLRNAQFNLSQSRLDGDEFYTFRLGTNSD